MAHIEYSEYLWNVGSRCPEDCEAQARCYDARNVRVTLGRWHNPSLMLLRFTPSHNNPSQEYNCHPLKAMEGNPD